MKVLFLDTETTGNEPGKDRLVSVAYKTDGKLEHEIFKPPRAITIDAMATHHITEEMVADKEPFSDSKTKRELEKLLLDHILVAHNAAFDVGILEAEDLIIPRFICTLKVTRALDKEGKIPRYAMQYLRYFWKLEVGKAVAHSADGDVLVLEALFRRLWQEMAGDGGDENKILGAMMKMSIRPSLIHKLHFGKYRGERLEDVAHKDPGYLEWLLGQKEAALVDGLGRYDDADMVYSLKYFLGRRTE